MNQDDIDKKPEKSCTIKILIPLFNLYPLKEIHRWARKVYHQIYLKVGWYQAQKRKEIMPIEMAAYAEQKVFGNWRLTAPAADNEISPLKKVLTWLRDEIVPTRWGQFRRAFVKELKIDFNAICDADYDPAMVDEVNGRLRELLAEYERGGERHPRLEFVLCPETAQDYSAPDLFAIRSAIWERFTGKPLDPAQYCPVGLSRQMAMELVLTRRACA